MTGRYRNVRTYCTTSLDSDGLDEEADADLVDEVTVGNDDAVISLISSCR